MALCALLIGGFGLSWLTYMTQAAFNRVPLENGLYGFTYLFTFPAGAFLGAVTTFAYRKFRPKGVWLIAFIAGVLVCAGVLAYLFFNPITNPYDPSFGVEH